MILAALVLTRLYGPSGLGVLSVYAAVLALMTIVAGLRYEIAIPLPEDDRGGLALLALVALCLVGTTIVVAVVTLLAGRTYASWFGGSFPTVYQLRGIGTVSPPGGRAPIAQATRATRGPVALSGRCSGVSRALATAGPADYYRSRRLRLEQTEGAARPDIGRVRGVVSVNRHTSGIETRALPGRMPLRARQVTRG
jgi:hypothetical protein